MSYLYDPWTSRERANLSEPRADVSSEHMYYHQAGGGAYNYGTPTGEPYSSPPSSYQSTFWPMSPSGEHVQPAHAAQSSSSGSAASDYPYGPYSRSHDDGKLESRTCHCGKVFRRNSDLTKHQKYHEKYFFCLWEGCNRAFATQKDLSRHMRIHQPKDAEGWKCQVEGCRKAASGHVYNRKDNYDRHMRTAHSSN